MKRIIPFIIGVFMVLGSEAQDDVQSGKIFSWENIPDRPWVGSDFWAQRLEDWSVEDQKLMASPQPGSIGWSAIHLLTSQLGESFESFSLEVELDEPGSACPGRFAGFLVGAGEGRLDHKAASMVFGRPGRGGGILAVTGIDNETGPVFLDNGKEGNEPVLFAGQYAVKPLSGKISQSKILHLEATPKSGSVYELKLQVIHPDTGEILAEQVLPEVAAERLRGNVALVFDAPGDGRYRQAFDYLRINGKRFVEDPGHAFGPIAGTLYTISGNTFKLSVQCLPIHVSKREKPVLVLEAINKNEEYESITGEVAITGPDYCALFRIENWDDSREVDLRVKLTDTKGSSFYYPVRVRRNPIDQDEVSMEVMSDFGLMSRNLTWKIPDVPEGYELIGRWTPANVWFPYKPTVDAVLGLEVDMASFTGDEFYENKPLEYVGTEPYKDGLWRWLMWHWAMQAITSKMPVLVQIDDHGMYQGNVWGDGGHVNTTGNEAHGGYSMAPGFLNMIQRICTAHLPDPYDPGRTDAGLTYYYTGFRWGGIGMALLEDRKFKAAPADEGIMPYEELNLLGEKQMQFIKEWGHDWENEEFKVILTQTVFANLHTGPNGDFARGDKDGNGWPKPGRDRALRLFRSFNAPVVCGDQHLPSFTLQGIDRPGDGVYQLCTPAAATHFWRWCYPPEGGEGQNRTPGDPSYLGDFTDPFGNFVKVLAMKQPASEDVARNHLDFRTWMVIPKEQSTGDTERTNAADGFGLVRFHKTELKIDFECYPYNYGSGTNTQHEGWPFTLGVLDLDPREGGYDLATFSIKGNARPVVQVINEFTGETVKMMRIPTGDYTPRVFEKGQTYTVRIGVPETGEWKTQKNLQPGNGKRIKVQLKQNPAVRLVEEIGTGQPG